MKNFNLKPLALASLTLLAQSLYAQTESEKVWVTFETSPVIETNINGKLISPDLALQTLIDDHNIISITQAVPASHKENLQKLYEVECNCDAIDLMVDMTSSTIELSNPEIGPKYELLYETNDYNVSFGVDYALDLIKAKGAWNYSIGDSNVIIGISDANYHLGNIDLIGKWVSFTSGNTNPNYTHGTVVALTAAGNTNNGVGKSSIGFNCRLSCQAMSYNYILQLSYAGSRIINASWTSGCTESIYVQNIIDEVYENGSIVVAAAGNGSTCGGPTNLVYPAACNHVIAVSSIGPMDNHERFIGDPTSTHQHNESVDICSPGYDIAAGTSWTFGPTTSACGTSFAAPYVSGTIGLMISLSPCLTFENVLDILTTSAVDIDGLNPNYAGLLGAGRLDAATALKMTSDYTCGEPVNDISTNFYNLETNHSETSNVQNAHGGLKTDLSEIDVVEFEVAVYPNPSDDRTTIKWNSSDDLTIKVVNLMGELVQVLAVSQEMNQTVLDIEHRGIYFIQFEREGQRIWSEKYTRI